jgi:hypothetical protein
MIGQFKELEALVFVQDCIGSVEDDSTTGHRWPAAAYVVVFTMLTYQGSIYGAPRRTSKIKAFSRNVLF